MLFALEQNSEKIDSLNLKNLLEESNKYASKAEYDLAYKYYNKYILLIDSLETVHQEKQLEDARTKYKSDRTERKIELLHKDAELNKLKLRARNFIIYLLVLVIFFIAIITALIIQLRKTKSDKEIADITQRNLSQQLNPEFIIQTVNSIQHSLYSQDKTITNQQLSKFSKLMRILLDNSQQKEIQLKKEIDMLRLYLDLQKFRLNNSVDYTINLVSDIDLLEIRIPSFLVLFNLQRMLNGKQFNNQKIIIQFDMNKKVLLCKIQRLDLDLKNGAKNLLSDTNSHEEIVQIEIPIEYS